MPKYIIEREVPNAAALSAADLKGISQRSCAALQQLGPDIQWVQSFVTEDKITCVYIASNTELVREHANDMYLALVSHPQNFGLGTAINTGIRET